MFKICILTQTKKHCIIRFVRCTKWEKHKTDSNALSIHAQTPWLIQHMQCIQEQEKGFSPSVKCVHAPEISLDIKEISNFKSLTNKVVCLKSCNCLFWTFNCHILYTSAFSLGILCILHLGLPSKNYITVSKQKTSKKKVVNWSKISFLFFVFLKIQQLQGGREGLEPKCIHWKHQEISIQFLNIITLVQILEYI